MEYQDMGKVRSNMPETAIGKKEKYYPSLSISSKQLSGLKNKKFGDKVELHIKGEIGGIHEDYDDKTQAKYEIKIKEAAIGGISKEKYLKMSDEEKDKADEKEVMDK